MLPSAPSSGPPLFAKESGPRFTRRAGRQKACGLPSKALNTLCTAALSGLHLKMRCQAGVGSHHPQAVHLRHHDTLSRQRHRIHAGQLKRFHPPRGSLPQARPQKNAPSPEQKAYSRFRRGRYTCRSRAPALSKQTHARRAFDLQPVCARRKSPVTISGAVQR